MELKSYEELSKLTTFQERFKYLKLSGVVGQTTFGYERYLNQVLYTSREWKEFRNKIIVRDEGCDLGIPGFEIVKGQVLTVHHINPITVKDVIDRSPIIFDPNNVICCTAQTHRAIHYGDESLLLLEVTERSPNDTCPWRK